MSTQNELDNETDFDKELNLLLISLEYGNNEVSEYDTRAGIAKAIKQAFDKHVIGENYDHQFWCSGCDCGADTENALLDGIRKSLWGTDDK